MNIRNWSLWKEPPAILRRVLAVYALYALVLAGAFWRSRGFPPVDVSFAVFIGVGGLLNHIAPMFTGFNHIRGPKGNYPDELWASAATIGLPGAYGMLAWVPAVLLYPVRSVARSHAHRIPLLETPLHRTVFNGCAAGLGVFVGHGAFVAAAGGAGVSARWLAAAVVGVAAGAVVQSIVTSVVICVANGRSFLWTMRDDYLLRAAAVTDTGLGILVAAAHAAFPWSVWFVLPFVNEIERSSQQDALLTASTLDRKTGLANADFWRHAAEGTIARANTGGPPVSVLLVDLDHFKRVNDTHGHLVGDDVLREVARRLTAAGRPGDLPGRFGGEEFTLLLPGADSDQARQVAERVREAVGAEPVRSGSLRVPVTCSIGVATAPAGGLADLPAVLAAADTAMYEAKRTGRDRVVRSVQAAR